MHFSVLVPVQVTVGELDKEKVAAAALRNSVLSTLLEGVDANDIGKKVSLEVEQKYCEALHNEFAVAVDAAVDEAMTPYWQDNEDPKYCIFEDETEDLRFAYENSTMEAIAYGAKYYPKYGLKGFKVGSDGIVREVTDGGQEFLSTKAKNMRLVTVPIKDVYKTFRSYANSQSNYVKEKKAWGYFSNPICFWDWFSIGGRWRAPLLVAENCEEYAIGVPGSCVKDSALPPAPIGYKWTSAARIKDIAFDAMVQQSIDEFTAAYNKYQQIWDTKILPQEKHSCYKIEADGLYSWGTKVFDPNIPLADALAKADYTIGNIMSRMLYARLDTSIVPGLDEDGEVNDGYLTNDCCDGDWEEHINTFIAGLDPETVLVIVDCHM